MADKRFAFSPLVGYNWDQEVIHMKKQGMAQETLKLIASITMLIDHAGATLVLSAFYASLHAENYAAAGSLQTLYYAMRLIGRIAFPIYCFQLVEGFHHTRDLKKYAGRLAIGVLLSELPFDLALNGTWFDWSSNSVMITMLLGCLMMAGMNCFHGWWKLLAIPPFYGIAELLNTDYAGHGILIIAMLALTRGLPREKLWRTVGFAVLLWFGATISFGTIEIPMEIFGLLSLIPIFCYDGRKLTRSRGVQWAFYLFYPVHLMVLWLLEVLIFG